MSRFGLTLALASFVFGLTGCASIHGTWELEKMEPADAPTDYVFARVVFKDDGSYNATAKESDDPMVSNGRYMFEDGTLTLSPEGDEDRTYGAQVTDFGQKLRVTKAMHGQEITAIMKKVDD